jgi:hypothetical protein
MLITQRKHVKSSQIQGLYGIVGFATILERCMNSNALEVKTLMVSIETLIYC